MAKKVTQKQAEKALAQVAQQFGVTIADGHTAPQLAMDFDWSGNGPNPAIIWEGGPADWAAEAKVEVTGVWTEPATGWALSIYRTEA